MVPVPELVKLTLHFTQLYCSFPVSLFLPMAAPSLLLSVSPSIPEAFASISNSASTSRCLYLRIVGEDITLLKEGGSAEGEVGEEFG